MGTLEFVNFWVAANHAYIISDEGLEAFFVEPLFTRIGSWLNVGSGIFATACGDIDFRKHFHGIGELC
jgi:hypothetical protein